MRPNFQIWLLLLIIAGAACTSHDRPSSSSSLDIGDPAPPLFVGEWLKGEPVQQYEKGMVYVVEFWATWCIPCKAAMPHLSDLAREYKDRVRFIGMDVKERKTTPLEKIKAFVDSMGHRMDYTVAVQDSTFMETNWLEAAKVQGIPQTFVINKQGILAWIGHPAELEAVLPRILDNTWDIKAVLIKRNEDSYLRELEDSLIWEMDLRKYKGDRLNPDEPGEPDSLLAAIDKIVSIEPKLKYTPFIAFHTFSTLLKTDPQKAYAYGKVAMVTPTYEEPVYSIIRQRVVHDAERLDLPPEIYRLGAEAYQLEIDNLVYPELVDMSKLYKEMGTLYWRAGDRLKATEAQQKAIDMLRARQDFSKAEMDTLVYQLRGYSEL